MADERGLGSVSVRLSGRIRAWWWIARHPIKSAAIRRYLIDRAMTGGDRG